MAAAYRGNLGANGTGSSLAVGVTTPFRTSFLLIAVGFSSATASVASITATGGTFAKIAGMTAGSQALEIWVGYNFGTSEPTTITVNQAASGPNMGVEVITIDIDADCTVAPTATASSPANGTSTAPLTASLTPAIGDLLVAAAVWANTSGSSARTSTGNTYLNDSGQSAGSIRVEIAWTLATAASASTEGWTITSGAWCALQAKWTPSAQSAGTALIVKGLTTAAADAASNF